MGTALVAADDVLDLGPQDGPQTRVAQCRTDMALAGGSVYGGKTWILTYLPTQHIGDPNFRCITFRRDRGEIRQAGGLWEESLRMYPLFGGVEREQYLDWTFPSGAKIQFDGLQYDKDARSHKSAQYSLVQFDQLEEFTEYQYWYMHSRNRHPRGGMNAYSRAGCNAMADTWLADFIQWWWDQETGYAIPERSGIARFFIRVDDTVVWASGTIACDAPQQEFDRALLAATTELERRFPGRAINRKTGRSNVRSFAFIRAKIEDNVLGVLADPDYEAKVRMGSFVEQERLLGGNWKIRAAAGLVFDRANYEIVPARPARVKRRVRYWDKAGTAGGGDWTVGTKESDGFDNITYVEDVVRGQWGAGDRENVIEATAIADTPETIIGVEQEPGSGGKDSALYTIGRLKRFTVIADRPTGTLLERCQPFAGQGRVRNVKLVAGPWNEAWLREHHAYDGTVNVIDDQVASSAGAYKLLHRPMPTPLYRRGEGSRSYAAP